MHGQAFVSASFSVSGIPCSSFNNAILAAVVNSLSVLLNVPADAITILQSTCSAGSRRSAGGSINLNVRIGVSSESSAGSVQALFTTITSPPSGGGTPAFATSLASNSAVAAALAAAGTTLGVSPAVVQLAIGGVNCSADAWTSWSPCVFQKCGGGNGIQTRSRRCPATSETQLCAATPCGNCSVNNGGCSGNATCSINSDGTAQCTCLPAFIGTGTSCTARTPAQLLSLVTQLTYPLSLSAAAPSLLAQVMLQAALLNQISNAVGVSLARFVFYQLLPTSNGFQFIFSIAPPLLPGDDVVDTIQTKLQAAVNSGQLSLTVDSSTGAVAPSVAASTSSTSFYPAASSGGGGTTTTSSSSDWSVYNTLYVVIAVAGFLGLVSFLLLMFVARRRGQSKVASSGPVWLPSSPTRVKSTGAMPGRPRSSVAPVSSSAALLSRQANSTPIIPVSPATPSSPEGRASRTTAWEAEAIENELPTMPGVRHYYPAWDSARNSVASPWI